MEPWDFRPRVAASGGRRQRTLAAAAHRTVPASRLEHGAQLLSPTRTHAMAEIETPPASCAHYGHADHRPRPHLRPTVRHDAKLAGARDAPRAIAGGSQLAASLAANTAETGRTSPRRSLDCPLPVSSRMAVR